MADSAFQSSSALFAQARKERSSLGMPSTIVETREPRRTGSSFSGIRTAHKSTLYRSARVVASMGEKSSAAEEYRKFSEMLGADPSTGADNLADSNAGEGQVDKKETSQSNAYAEFSSRLGLEGERSSDGTPGGRVSRPDAKPKQAEIDPADYKIFDSLLRQSGGTGRKSLKGSKRFMKRPPPSEVKRKQVDEPFRSVDSSSSTDNVPEDQSGPEEVLRRPTRFTEQEKADAYAFMREEFGSSIHGLHPAKQKEEGLNGEDKEQVEPVRLVTPPMRPDDAISEHIENTVVASAGLESGVRKKDGKESPPPTTFERKQADESLGVVGNASSTQSDSADQSRPEKMLQRPTTFTEQEKAVAYAFMREEFGSDMHGLHPAKRKDKDLSNEEGEQEEPVSLVTPPRRPDDAISKDTGSTGMEPADLESGPTKKNIKESPSPAKVERKRVSESLGVVGSTRSTANVGVDYFGPQKILQKPTTFTEQEKADAYAFMREEFGSGMHGLHPGKQKDEDSTEEEEKQVEPVRLVTPPKRPNDASGEYNEDTMTVVKSARLESEAQEGDMKEKPSPAKVERKRVGETLGMVGGTSSTESIGADHTGPEKVSQKPAKFSEKEKAEAYAFMREEFGSGVHGVDSGSKKEEDLNEEVTVQIEPVRLVTPPRMPEPSISEDIENATTVGKSAELESDGQNKDDRKKIVALNKRPSRSNDVKSSEDSDSIGGGSYMEANIIETEMDVGEIVADPLLPKPVGPSSLNESVSRTTRLSENVRGETIRRPQRLGRKQVADFQVNPGDLRQGANQSGRRAQVNRFDSRRTKEYASARHEKAGLNSKRMARGRTGTVEDGSSGERSRGAHGGRTSSIGEQKTVPARARGKQLRNDLRRPEGRVRGGGDGETSVRGGSRGGQREKARNKGTSAEVIGPGEMEVEV